MNFPAHVKAFWASWIRMLFEPRVALWKRIVQEWLPFPVGYLISKLSHSERRLIRNSIPSQAIYIKAALEAFWSLKITMDFDSIDNKIKGPDFLRGLPLFN